MVLILTSCGTSLTKDAVPPKTITAQDACPKLPEALMAEGERRTGIPRGEMTKSQVMNLFRKYATSEVRKNYTITQIGNLYTRCRAFWLK